MAKKRGKLKLRLIRGYAENLPGSVLATFCKEFKGLVQKKSGIYAFWSLDVQKYPVAFPVQRILEKNLRLRSKGMQEL